MSSSLLESFQFLTEPSERLRCLICYELAEIPVQHEDCGKVFCKACINKNADKPCPNCRSGIQNYFIDLRCAQEIEELSVQCSHTEKGCSWKGTISNIEQHLLTCSHATLYQLKRPEKAVNETSCHLISRPIQHQVNGAEKVGCSTAIRAKKTRLKRQVTPAHCTPQVKPRSAEEKEDHHIFHPHTILACKHPHLGRKERLQKRVAQDHDETSKGTDINIALKKMEIISEKASTLEHGEYFAFKLTGFNKLKHENRRYYSDAFYSCQRYKLRVLVDCNGCYQATGTHLSVAIEIMRGRHDSELDWPFCGVVTLVLLNQLADTCHIKQVLALKPPNCSTRAGSVVGIWQFLPLSQLSGSESTESVQYLVDDTLYFRVKADAVGMKPWLSTGKIDVGMAEIIRKHKMIGNAGKYTVKLANFSKTFGHLVSHFSIEPGYSAAIAISSNIKHLSISVTISERPFGQAVDALSGTVRVEILNQLGDRNHYSKCLETVTVNTESATVTYKSTEFISTATLISQESDKTTQYLKDDSLFFRVGVSLDAQDDRPWLDTKEEFAKLYTITAKKDQQSV